MDAATKKICFQLKGLQKTAVCGTKPGTPFTVQNYDKYQGNQSKNKEFFVDRNDDKMEPDTEFGTTCVQLVYNTKKDKKE